MPRIQPRPGFDWGRVTWGRPDSPQSALCSYCHAAIGIDDVPLIMWKQDGSAAQFCDRCQVDWWGEDYTDGTIELASSNRRSIAVELSGWPFGPGMALYAETEAEVAGRALP